MKKTFIGSFPTQERLITKIDELNRKGVRDEEMYVVMKDELAVAELKNQTAQDSNDGPSSMFDRFLGFLSGEDHVKSMLADAGFTDGEAEFYFDAVQDGAILLYIDGTIDKEKLLDHAADESRYGGYDPLTAEEIEAVQQEGL